MSVRIGELELPYRSPNFLSLRVALRPYAAPQVVVGLSGGPDSLALTAAARAEGMAVHAVCVDHQLQPGSRRVSDIAAEQARRMGCTAEVLAVDVAKEGSLEAAARDARYAALSSFESPVWVGHTMDDQAETYLLGALRGNPTGMLPRTPLGNTELVRPFLGIRRRQTVGACEELGLTPWQDPHNQSTDFRRVALRKGTIPGLAKVIHGDAVIPLAQAATRAAQLQDFVRSEVVGPEVASLSSVHPAVRRESIAEFLRANDLVVSAATVDAVERLVTQWNGQGPVAVGGNGKAGRAGRRVWVRRVGGKLVIERDS